MEFSGEFTTPIARERVYAFLTNPAQVGSALPDVEEIVIHDPTSFTARILLGISYLRGNFSVRLQRTAAEAGLAASYVGKGLGIGSSVEMEASFALDDIEGGGSRVRWTGKARLFGKILSLGGGLIEPIARKNTTRFIESLLKGLDALDKHAIEPSGL
jgi:carbon monoxide dehydrogenase subunit G